MGNALSLVGQIPPSASGTQNLGAFHRQHYVFLLLKCFLISLCIALLRGHAALVCQVQLSPTILATGGADGRVITFSLTTYTPLQCIDAHESSITSLQFDKHFLITSGNDGRARLFDS